MSTPEESPSIFNLNRLPNSELYEQSYMHKEEIASIAISIQTNLIVTGSQDGVIKFWKKLYRGIEFSKQYRAHLSSIICIAISPNGSRIASISALDPSIKIYDALSLDMIDKVALTDNPIYIELAQTIQDSEPFLIVSTASQLGVAQLLGAPVFKFMEIHSGKVLLIKYNHNYNACISIDDAGIIEY